MNVKPLWLREKLFWKIYANRPNKFSALSKKAYLEFAPKVSLHLLETDVSHQMIAFTGFYELLLSRQFIKLAQAGGLMVDVGANYGYYSCLWAATKFDNHVVAFEASPRNCSMLSSNLVENKLESQVQTIESAVGKEAGKLQFDLGPDEQSGWGGLLLEKSKQSVEVSVVSLDDFFAKKDVIIDVLKIDTEGADTWVIQGAIGLLRAGKIRHIFFEENVTRMSELFIEPGEAQKLLVECGYCVEQIDVEEWHGWLAS